jgi:hypothetical protein
LPTTIWPNTWRLYCGPRSPSSLRIEAQPTPPRRREFVDVGSGRAGIAEQLPAEAKAIHNGSVDTKRSQEGQGNDQLIDNTGRLVSDSNIAMKLNCEGAEQAGAKAVPGRLLDLRAA